MKFCKHLIIGTFLLFIVCFSFSQKVNKGISLVASENVKLGTDSIHINDIRVVQVIPDSTIWGYVQKGIGNKLVLAGPKKSITEDIQQYLSEQYKGLLQPNGASLLIVIKELRINERTFAMKERAYVHFSGDSWVSVNNNNQYVRVATLDTVFKTGGMDVTGGHGRNITKSLRALVDKTMYGINSNGNNNKSILTYEEVVDKAKERFNVPILQEQMYKQGLYATYNDFLQNNPPVIEYRTETSKKRGVIFWVRDEDGLEKQYKPWGLSKNNELYIYHNNNLIPVERSQNGFIISAYMEERKRRNQAILIGAIAGGLTGFIVTSAVGTGTYVYIPVSGQSQGMLLTNIPVLGNEQPEPSQINFETGELYF